MSDYHYIIKASTGNNVGIIQAESEDDAMKQLKEIFAPDHIRTGEPHALLEIELITPEVYETEKVHIAAVRKAEAEA